MRAAFLLAIVLGAALAGCTGLTPTDDEPIHVDGDFGRSDIEESRQVIFAADPGPPARSPVPATVSLERAWLRPYQPAAASLATAPDATVAWFLEAEGDDVRLTHARGELYASKASTPQEHHHHAGGEDDHDDSSAPAGPRRTRADAGEIAPGGRPRALAFQQAGRYLLATPEGVTVNVTVRPEAPPGPIDAYLVGADGSARFVPDELDVPPGARVLFWNQAAAPVVLLEAAFLTQLPGNGRSASFVPVDEGLWRLHAVVRQGERGLGLASEPFLVDYERPAERSEIGPLRGRLVQADASLPRVEERSLSVSATFPIERLDLAFNASTALPAPGSVRVLVVSADGRAVADASSAETATLSLRDLPAGRYDVVVRGERGSLVDFDLAGVAAYRLPTPERLLAAR